MDKRYEEIKEKFQEVIAYSQTGISDPDLTDLFDRWYEAKKEFIKTWDGQLIYEWPEKISFELDQKAKDRKLDSFLDRLKYHYADWSLATFIEDNRADFYSNILTESYTIPETKEVIPKGMKIVKAFKFFESGRVLEDIQNEASLLLQEDKVTGRLCLSVHPLDFLSSSENTCNWRSCHSLDGDYRAGNLSYMVDNTTIMCYLKSDNEQIIPNFPFSWNSKKWRVLLFFSDDRNMVFAGRQYPFSSEAGIDFVRKTLLPKSGFGEWTDWLSKKISSVVDGKEAFYFVTPYIPIGDHMEMMSDIIQDQSKLHFDDLLQSTCYDPIYAFRIKPGRHYFASVPTRIEYYGQSPHFKIGGKIKCLRCGSDYIQMSETMMCGTCELEYGDSDSDDFAFCPCCDRRFYYDEGAYLERYEEMICPNCFDTEVVQCDCCGDYVYEDDTIYDKYKQTYICRSCDSYKNDEE